MSYSDYRVNLKNFEKGNMIGKGISSQVFKIIEKKTDQVYVAKIILNEFNENNRNYQIEFLRQVELFISLNHPSINKFIGFSFQDFTEERRPVIISEYAPNGSLSEVLSKERNGQPQIGWNDTKKLINIYGIAAGMSYLHKLNIIHGDLSPNNILETSQFHPQICDLRTSKCEINTSRNIENQSVNVKGTIPYIAPEILDKEEYTQKCDVYSFGMIVYSILTGKVPFEHVKTSYKIMEGVIQGKREPVDDEKIPKKFQELICACWSVFPIDRPSFESIVTSLRDDEEYITEKINKEEFQKYIHFINSFNVECKEEEEEAKEMEVKNELNEQSFEEEDIKKELKEEDIKKTEYQEKPFLTSIQSLQITKFKQNEKIGYGAFSSVYKILDKETERTYAAKIMKNEFYESFKDTKSGIYLSREVTILSQTDHPCIMQFIGYSPVDFKDTLRPVIITEYFQNGSLENIIEIDRSGFLISEWSDTMRLINIYGIASALRYLHSNNIIHRDLKPDNILLDEHLFPKLSDFGFAKSLLQEENSKYKEIHSNAIGTPSFTAPEIYKDNLFLKAGDVYSFALVVYEILTKLFPFDGFNEFQIQYKVVFKEERPEFTNQIPDVYKDLIERCWNQDPNKRPKFDEIIEELKTNKNFITSINADESFYHSYIKYIEGDSSKIAIFPSFYLKFNYQEYQTKMEYETGPGLINLSKFHNPQKINVLHGQLFSYKKYELSNKIYTIVTTRICVNFTKEQKDKIINEVFMLSQMKHLALHQFKLFSFSNFKKKIKPTTIYEFLPHITLFDIINQKKKLTSTNKLIIIYGIASAMSFLHENEICNPYLSPMNVLIDKEYHPKLSEIGVHFQFLYIIIQSKQTSIVNNIPNCYFSPELKRSNKITEKSDVYSFSLIVLSIIIDKILTQNQIDLDLNKQIPDIYRELIIECIQKEPSKRPSFSTIVERLKTDERFLSNNVNEVEYRKYIKYVESGTVHPIISSKALDRLDLA